MKKFVSLLIVTIIIISNLSVFALPENFGELREVAEGFEANAVLRHAGKIDWELEEAGDAVPETSEEYQLGLFNDKIADEYGLNKLEYRLRYFYDEKRGTVMLFITDNHDNYSYVTWKKNHEVLGYYFSSER